MFKKSANHKCFKYCGQEYVQILWTRICSNIVDKNMFKYCRQEYVQILSTFKYCRQEYCPHFGTGMKILSIYKKNLNVGHSKSGFAHSFPRVDKNWRGMKILSNIQKNLNVGCWTLEEWLRTLFSRVDKKKS